MKKIILGIIIGVVLTISLQYAWNYYQYITYKDDVHLLEIVKHDLERVLKGTRVLDVDIGPNSKTKVNYTYDKLYDVHINYERDGKIKKITTQYGISKGTWITLGNTDFEILDNNAEVIFNKTKD